MEKGFRVLVDSNVWFSAFYKKDSIPSKLIQQLFERKAEIVISQGVLEEIFRNIKRKLPQALPLIKNFFKLYPVTVVKDPSLSQIKKIKNLAKAHDLPVLSSAINYNCNFFITGNKKDFASKKIKQKFNLVILNPREFLERAKSSRESSYL